MFTRRLLGYGLNNLRDLGGFATTTDSVTKFGVIVRSELPINLNFNHIERLKNYGVKNIIDMRSKSEVKQFPSSCNGDSFKKIYIPLDSNLYLNSYRKIGSIDWGEYYIRILQERADWIFQVFLALALLKDGTLLHCTTGKDRTGIITALLLDLIGVPEEDIIADYSVSQIYLKQTYQKVWKLEDDEINESFLITPPKAMSDMLSYVHNDWGSTANFLRKIGFVDKLQKLVVDKMIL